MKSFFKDVFREFKNNISKVLSIMVMVGLGALVIVGLNTTGRSMRDSLKAKVNDYSAPDIKVSSLYKLTYEDEALLETVEGLDKIVYENFVDARRGNKDLIRIRPAGKSPDYELVQGKMPEKEDELALDYNYFMTRKKEGEDLSIGEEISLSSVSDEKLDKSLENTSFTLVGLVNSPEYLMNDYRGISPMGKSQIDAFAVVKASNFKDPDKLEARLYLADSKDMDKTSEEYRDFIQEKKEEVEDLLSKRPEERLEEIRSDANEEISDAEDKIEDVEDKISEGEKELKDAEEDLSQGFEDYKRSKEDFNISIAQGQEEINNAQKKLDQSKKDLDQGERDYYQAKEDLADKLASYQDKIDSGREDLVSSRVKLDQGWQEYEDGLAELDQAFAGPKKELDQSKKDLDMARSELDEGWASYEERRAQLKALEERIDEIRSAIDEIENTPVQPPLEPDPGDEEPGKPLKPSQNEDDLEELKNQYQALLAKYKEEKAKLDKTAEILNAKEEEYDQGLKEYEAAKADFDQAYGEKRKVLDQAKEELDQGEAEYKKGEAELKDYQAQLDQAQTQGDEKLKQSYDQLVTGRTKYQSGLIELEEGQRKLNEEKAQGEEKLKDAYSDLVAGQEDLEKAKEDFDEKSEEADKEISEGNEDIEEAKENVLKLTTPDYKVSGLDDDPGFYTYRTNTERMDILSKFFPSFFYLVAMLVTITTMKRKIDEDRLQIGTLKSLGYSNRQIGLKFYIYGLLPALVGSILGIIGGRYILSPIIYSAYTAGFTVGDQILNPRPDLAIFTLLLSLALIFVTIYLTTRKTVNAVPAQLLRPKPPKAGSRILLERIKPIWSRLDFLEKVTARNIFRYKSRMFMTIFGVAGCTALVFFGFALKDSVLQLLPIQFDQIMTYDIMAVFDPDHDQLDSYLDTIASEKTLLASVEEGEVSLDPKDQSISIVSFDNTDDLDDFIYLKNPRGEKLDLDKEGVIITEKISKMTGLGPGDKIEVSDTDDKVHELEISAVAENHINHYLFISKDHYEDIFNKAPEMNTHFIITSDSEALENKLTNEGAVLNTMIISNLESSSGELLGALNMVIAVITLVSAILAIVVLYNLTNVNVSERKRELSTIKVLGFYPKELTSYIYRETWLLTILGILIGYFLGYLMYRYIIRVVVPDEYMLVRHILPKSYFIAAAITLVISFIVMLVVHRKLKKIDMVEALSGME